MSLRGRLQRFVQTDAWRKEQAKLWAARHFPESARATAARLADMVVAQTGVQFEKIAPSSRFVEDLGLGDLQDVEIIMKVGKEFGVSIPSEDAERVSSISGLVAYLGEGRT